MDVASGSPTIQVSTANAILLMYADLSGTQGFTKTGAGTLSFRFSGRDLAYTGTVTLGGGALVLEKDRSLGAVNNPILVTANSTLSSDPGANSGTVTIGAGRATTINSGVTLTVQNGRVGPSTVLNNPIGGAGNLTLANSGTITVGAANAYTGNTLLSNLTRANLSSGANFSTSGSLTISTGAATTYGTTLDLGGNTQSVRGLSISSGTTAVTHTVSNGSLNVTAGNVSLAGSTGATTSGTSTVSLAGLSSFTFNNSAGTFTANVQTNGSGTNVTAVTLANTGSGANSITANSVTVGGASSFGVANATSLGLGKANTVNTNTLAIGAFNGSGTIAFQPGVSNGTFVLRGTAGGVSRATTVTVGETSSGTRDGSGTLDLSGGSLDGLVSTLKIGRHVAGSNNGPTSRVVMPDGTLDASLIVLGEKSDSAGTPTISSTFSQLGGTVTTGTIVFGNTLSGSNTATALFNSTYNLSSGTLRAAVLTTVPTVALTGSNTSNSASIRRIAWSGGSISNYDASTDLVVSGTSTNAGYTMQLVLSSTTTPQVFLADAGRTITIQPTAVISGTGQLQKQGAGSLIFNGSNSFAGSLAVNAGTLTAGNVNAFGAGAVTVASGATLDLNSLGIANAITNNGGTVSNAANYAGSQTLSGAVTFGTLGGTLVVANGGNATFGGALAAATTINAGGNGTLNNAGSITAASLANNGTFTIDRTGTSSLATVFTGNGTLVKAGAGVVTLSGSSSFSGATQVNAGDLRVDGSLAGGVSVASTGLLGGSGIVGAISGAGLVGPGNSPGILTSNGVLDPTGGIDFSFELTGAAPTWSAATASVNDVLHLTAATPMTAALGGSNTVNVYLNAGSLTSGNTFLGGIFIDQTQATLDLASLVSGATFEYFVAGGNDVTYNGVGYSTLANYMTANPGVTGISASTATVASADFATGTVTNGQAMQFAIVPEPGAMVLMATGALAAGWAGGQRARRMRARAASSHWRHG
jgi:fibronectin-binding autotransporter adhesin